MQSIKYVGAAPSGLEILLGTYPPWRGVPGTLVSIASSRGGSEGKGSSIPPSSSEVLWTHTRDARRDMLGADWVGYPLAALTGHSLVRF